jgi:putative DNA-invertase from lambdoid prophage Rac
VDKRDRRTATDVGISGGIPLSDRPNGSKLVAKGGKGDLVIASNLDRLFRSASDALATVERWQRIGVDLILAHGL